MGEYDLVFTSNSMTSQSAVPKWSAITFQNIEGQFVLGVKPGS